MQQEHLHEQCIGFVTTQPLWKKEQFGIQQFEFPSLDLQSFQPQAIPQHIRLGHQMEYIFKQLLNHSKAYEIVLHNLAIRAGKQTLGEIDFMLRDTKTLKLIHVELTYKFYLIDHEISEPIHRLVGPNRHDAFFDKMQKIKNKQFALLHSEDGVKVLNNNNIDHSIVEHQCCFKAQLFQPYKATSIDIHPLNENCIIGYWIRFEVFKTEEFLYYKYYILSKSQWAIVPNDEVLWQSFTDILNEVNLRLENKRSPMLWVKKSATEFEKLFVVWWN